VDALTLLDLTQPDDFLIRTTGVYYIVITNADNFANTGEVPNIGPGSGNVGKYQFTVQVFDDGDSGFAAGNNSGNGTPVVNAPRRSCSPGQRRVPEPRRPRVRRPVRGHDRRLPLHPGPRRRRHAGHGRRRGLRQQRLRHQLDPRRQQHDVHDQLLDRARRPHRRPRDVASDVDIYHLNNGQTITPARSSPLPSSSPTWGGPGRLLQLTLTDFRGDVQFGVFDTTDATGIDDAKLIFSPTDFTPRSGDPGEIARVGQSVYGYNADGDFFISFVVPSHLGTAGQPPKLAVYIQGAFTTDYSVRSPGRQRPAAPGAAVQAERFIETVAGRSTGSRPAA
jgi:hypothetical protein